MRSPRLPRLAAMLGLAALGPAALAAIVAHGRMAATPGGGEGAVPLEWVELLGGPAIIFELTRAPVTVDQYAICVAAGACTPPGTGLGCNWGVEGRGDHAADCVTWDQANRFARWVGGRLPTAQEYATAAGRADRPLPEGAGWAPGARSRPVCSDPEAIGVNPSRYDTLAEMVPGDPLCDLRDDVAEWINREAGDLDAPFAFQPALTQTDEGFLITARPERIRSTVRLNRVGFRVARSRPSSVAIVGLPAGGRVWIDEAPFDPSSGDALLEYGPHSFYATAPGYAPRRFGRTVELATMVRGIDLEMTPLPDAYLPPEGAAPPAPPPGLAMDWVWLPDDGDGGLWAGASEVTAAQYAACVDAGACPPAGAGGRCNFEPGGAPLGDRPLHPANCVDWQGAAAFAQWAGGRLPRPADWRRMYGDARWPWGAEPSDCARAVVNDGGPGCGQLRTSPVCAKQFGLSAGGLCDLVGNVAERVLQGADWRRALWPELGGRAGEGQGGRAGEGQGGRAGEGQGGRAGEGDSGDAAEASACMAELRTGPAGAACFGLGLEGLAIPRWTGEGPSPWGADGSEAPIYRLYAAGGRYTDSEAALWEARGEALLTPDAGVSSDATGLRVVADAEPAHLRLRVEPPEASAWIDGLAAGAIGGERTLSARPGERVVIVEAPWAEVPRRLAGASGDSPTDGSTVRVPRYRRAQRTVDLRAGRTKRLSLTLAPIRQAPPAALEPLASAETIVAPETREYAGWLWTPDGPLHLAPPSPAPAVALRLRAGRIERATTLYLDAFDEAGVYLGSVETSVAPGDRYALVGLRADRPIDRLALTPADAGGPGTEVVVQEMIWGD